MQLNGKAAFITGAGSEIEKAAALLFAHEGAKIVALGITEDELGDTIQEIESFGSEALAVGADVSQVEPM